MLGPVKVTLQTPPAQTQLGPGGQQLWVPQPGQVHPMGVLLFGKRPPKKVDKKKHPRLGKALRKLEALKEQIAPFAGAGGGELELELCEGDNASISRDGTLHVGVELLEEHQRDDDFLVAVMGHEIGHAPWTWPNFDLSRLTRAQRDQLYRDEEAKADRFAGRILAELDADPRSVCRFLIAAERFEQHPPTDYYPAETRAKQIQEAFTRRRRLLEVRARGVAGIARRPKDLR